MRFLALVMILATGMVARAADHRCGSIDVDRVTFPVKLSDGQTYPVVGFRYHRGEGSRVLQIAVHGASDDHRYWDIPDVNGRSYSYARWMACRGHDVLAIDQIGAGESGKPDGDFLNTAVTVDALRQVIDQVKDKRKRPVGYFKILALVGHSFGAEQVALVQALHGQGDAILLGGWGHTVTPLPACPLPDLFANPYVAPGTFTEEEVACFFYWLPTTDPDELHLRATALSSTISRGQFSDVLAFYNDRTLDHSDLVKVPVFVQFGDHDALYPAAAEAPDERMAWPSSLRVEVVTLPNIGHLLNGHVNHLENWLAMDKSLRSLRHTGDDR